MDELTYATIKTKPSKDSVEKVISFIFNSIKKQEIKLEKELTAECKQKFRKKLTNFINRQFAKIHCCNLRTTDSQNNKLCELAGECGIPVSYLPDTVSIIINSSSTAFYYTDINHKKYYL